jgi:hypothetical protein
MHQSHAGATTTRKSAVVVPGIASFVLLVADVSRAEPPPTPVRGDSGAEHSSSPPPTTPSREAEATASAVLNSGNVEGAAVRFGGYAAFRSGGHAVRGDLSFGLAALAVDADADPANGFTRFDADGTAHPATLLDNVNSALTAKVRYDHFVAAATSLYAAASAQHDSALQLLVRLRGELGGRQFIFLQSDHALAVELGVAYTIDDGIFDATNADTNGDGRISVWGDATSFEKSGGIVAPRFAIVYRNALLERVSFGTMVEVLPNVSFAADVPVFGFVDAPFEPARLGGDGRLGLGEATIANSMTTVAVHAGGGFSLGLVLGVTYDAGAVARRNAMKNADAAVSVQLGYRFF